MKKFRIVIGLSVLLIAAGLLATQLINLNPGDNALVTCPNSVSSTVQPNSINVYCATNTPSPVPTDTPVPTLTPVPTDTPVPTAIPTSTPIPTLVPTATPTSNGLVAVDPAILGTCTAIVHDRYVVTGPDGKLYRTWHPQTVLIDLNNPSLGTCTFAHEHGDDPRTSVANNTMPAFEYIGQQAGFAEPHQGFKVYVLNAGYVVDDGGVAQVNTRTVVHMGTDGVGRFDTRYHSMTFDLTSSDGHFVHLQGMADTNGSCNNQPCVPGVGSICASPRQGKTVVTLPGTGCDLHSTYEIWNMNLTIQDANGNGAQAVFAPSAFDPITLMNPNDLPGHRTLYYTANYYPGTYLGCRREGYSGPVYWRNPFAQTTFLTDAFGNIGKGNIVQQISTSTSLGVRMTSTNFYQAKETTNYCAPGLEPKN